MNGSLEPFSLTALLRLWLCFCLLPVLLDVDRSLAEPLDPLSPASFEVGIDEEDDTALFVVGNTLFAVFHELGHALVDLLNLPVVGREEDAADGFAAVLMIPPDPDPVRDQLIVAVADGWRLQGEQTGDGVDQRPLWTEHTLDEQRYFAVICWLVGSDQEGFFDLANEAGMPLERIESCAGEFDRMKAGWQDLLKGHGADGSIDERPIAVVFEPPYAEDVEAFEFARLGGAIERSILYFAGNIDLPEKITVRFTSCDEANAFWYGAHRDVVICYELIDDFIAVLLDNSGL